jgi:hypothetical protein
VWVIYFLEKLFRVLRRAVLLDCYANKHARGALGEIVEPLKAMTEKMIEYALEHGTSQKANTGFSTKDIGISIHGCLLGLLRVPIEMPLGWLKPLESF